ncbi:hypothetical protein ARMGADRAFT_59229 [Armillaria gallica]|uniref:Uncharacterized protein n=1 Tax=Armillaria gallica TaxID=47427 RepID=A0A2H3E235_ARMGA|nr:hypothetical protein ARMGADRAFT_59229 [Armillaria gallica]
MIVSSSLRPGVIQGWILKVRRPATSSVWLVAGSRCFVSGGLKLLRVFIFCQCSSTFFVASTKFASCSGSFIPCRLHIILSAEFQNSSQPFSAHTYVETAL